MSEQKAFSVLEYRLVRTDEGLLYATLDHATPFNQRVFAGVALMPDAAIVRIDLMTGRATLQRFDGQ